MDNIRKVKFTNGNVTEYIYSASDEKLRTIDMNGLTRTSLIKGIPLTPGLNTYQTIKKL